MKSALVFGLLLLFSITSAAQNNEKSWVPVGNTYGNQIYIDISDISRFKGDDIYVWAKQRHEPPLVIEGIEDKIYRTKTYYLINKKLKKYSFLQIIYYDKKGNVIKSFDYKRPSNVEKYKYNYPVIEGSNAESILQTCITYLNRAESEG
jgi:hypothetical protein